MPFFHHIGDEKTISVPLTATWLYRNELKSQEQIQFLLKSVLGAFLDNLYKCVKNHGRLKKNFK